MNQHTMWAIRRASNPLRGRPFIIQNFQNSYPTSQVASPTLYNIANNGDSHMAISDRCTCLKSSHCSIHSFSKFSLRWCGFSSQADSHNTASEEDDLEDGFSELEDPSEIENESSSEPEISEEQEDCEGTKEPQDEILLSEKLVIEKNNPKKGVIFSLFNAIVRAPINDFESALNKWVENGNEFNQSAIYEVTTLFRQRSMYAKALQFSEWLESSNRIEFIERNYSSRVDLIAKVHGLYAAEKYINTIPESFKNEVIYRTFLASCVSSNNIKKSEMVFNKMKDLGFSLSSFSCNQLLLLYKRNDKKKLADVLLLMEKENVKPTLFTYGILIDVKGECNDIPGMEQIVESMKAEGVELDFNVKAILAKHYVGSGFNEKAESILQEIEGEDLKERKWVCSVVIPLYASLGKSDDVARVWQVCESNPRLEDCIAATTAWGKLGNIKKAEDCFVKMTKITNKLSSKHYTPLLRVYANHKMLKKGIDLVTRMAESGIIVGPHTWDDLVKLYISAGEVEKADSVLQKATQQSQLKPFISSYMTIMEVYANKGDVHNTEKIFYRMRQAGYIYQFRQFEPLIRAYINANVPAYGIRERMRADNIIPNNKVLAMLARVDPFRKTPVSALLD